jgi:UDP-glucose 4-epimerase
MKILVTGASGFLGLNILAHLSRAHPNAAVIAADLHPPAPADLAELGSSTGRVVFERLDVCDAAACLQVLLAASPTHIIHGAAVTSADETAAGLILQVNRQGAENILKAATAAGSVQRSLLLSSSGVYNQALGNRSCREDDPLDLDNIYARSKRDAELLMHVYERGGNVPIAAARIGPAYGPFERRRETRPRLSLIRRLLDFLSTGRALRIAGTDIDRDWTHAADIAAALDALLFAPILNHRIYNVGAGQSISAREIVALFVEEGLPVEWTSEDRADIFLDPRENRKPLAIERLQSDTGFKPRYDLPSGLRHLMAAEKTQIEHLLKS